MEDWYSCKGYEGYLEVTKSGSVRSIDRFVQHKGSKSGFIYRKGKLLKPSLTLDGYHRIASYYNGERKHQGLHRLIAQTFLPNPNNFSQVNHISGVKLDNSVINLEWCTQEDNMRHAINTGLLELPAGEYSRHFKGFIKVYKNGELIETLCGNIDMVAKGYLPSSVSQVLSGKLKSHKGCTFVRQPL
jgi:hypothetical protein